MIHSTSCCVCYFAAWYPCITPPKTIMDTQNSHIWKELKSHIWKEIHFKKPSFLVFMLDFRGPAVAFAEASSQSVVANAGNVRWDLRVVHVAQAPPATCTAHRICKDFWVEIPQLPKYHFSGQSILLKFWWIYHDISWYLEPELDKVPVLWGPCLLQRFMHQCCCSIQSTQRWTFHESFYQFFPRGDSCVLGSGCWHLLLEFDWWNISKIFLNRREISDMRSWYIMWYWCDVDDCECPARKPCSV